MRSALSLLCHPVMVRNVSKTQDLSFPIIWSQGEVSAHVVQKLLHLCACLDAVDWAGANACQVDLTTSDWDEAGPWLTAIKRLTKARQAMG